MGKPLQRHHVRLSVGSVCDYHEMVEQMNIVTARRQVELSFAKEFAELRELGGPLLLDLFRNDLVNAVLVESVTPTGRTDSDFKKCVEEYLRGVRDVVREHNEKTIAQGGDPAKSPWRLQAYDEGEE